MGFAKDLDLTKEQQDVLKEIKAEAKEMKKERKENRSKLNWMQEYAEGSTSQREVLSDIEERNEDKLEFKLEMTKNWLEFIDLLDEEQREQAIENIEEKDGRGSGVDMRQP